MESASPINHSSSDVSPRHVVSDVGLSSSTYTTKYPLKDNEHLHDINPRADMTLEEFARQMRAQDIYDVFFAYTTIIQSDWKFPARVFDKHEPINRYRDIRCIDATRVKAPRADGKHDYVHANFVDGYRERNKFILSQAPMEESLEQFWTMIWNEHVVIVVAVTAIDGRRCAKYIPTSSGKQVCIGPYRITHRGTRHVRDTYDATVLLAEKNGELPRTLLHIAYYTWSDKGTPRRPTEALHLIDDINHNRTQLIAEAVQAKWFPEDAQSPILVHCVTGVGRSATLAALDICLRKVDQTQKVNIRDTVERMRTQRDMAVQKPLHFLFLHLAVLEYAVRKRYFDDTDCIDLGAFMAKPATPDNA